jgi:hypothetical protein
MGYHLRQSKSYLITLSISWSDNLCRGIISVFFSLSSASVAGHLFVLAADVELVLELARESRHLAVLLVALSG